MTVTEIARRLRVSPATVHRILERGEMPHIRAGKQRRVYEHEMQAWIRRGMQAHRK